MADRYWVGGSGTWNTTSTTNWSATPGGAGGASVPTSADSVFFVQTATYTVTCTGALNCLDLNVGGGTVTIAQGTSPTFAIRGYMSLIAGTVWSATGAITFTAITTNKQIVTNGTTLAGSVIFNGVGGSWFLSSALTTSGTITLTTGSLTTNNYNITATGAFVVTGTLTRSITLGSSVVTVGASSTTAFSAAQTTNLTFNAGTSEFIFTNTGAGINVASTGLTFYKVNFTSTSISTSTIAGNNTFSIFQIVGATSANVTTTVFSANQTIGTLTIGAGASPACRRLIASNDLGTQRTLAVTTVSATADIDFRDIAITGTTLTGTRLGNCQGNSGITFPAAKTVYWAALGASTWADANSWSFTNGGAADSTAFPLAQDTAIFPAAIPAAGVTATNSSSGYNVGTVDMSLRTTNAMTLDLTSSLNIFGNWINGTGITLSGSSTLSFLGRSNQTITSAGRTYTQRFVINSLTGFATLQDALTSSSASSTGLSITSGNFSANGFNVTFSGASAGVDLTGVRARSVDIGSGTWTLAGTYGWNVPSASGLSVFGSGTLSFTSASTKTFNGADIQTYPTINQGGAGQLNINGSNKFQNITNTYKATGATTVTFAVGSTNTFAAFNLSGEAGRLCTLKITSGSSAALLRKPTTWFMGANSINAGFNTGLTFTAGGSINYLSVSYITGQVVTLPSQANFFQFF